MLRKPNEDNLSTVSALFLGCDGSFVPVSKTYLIPVYFEKRCAKRFGMKQ
uniref:Uncharacterized protein n=1 Tax=Arion vulgaris TaxID=1028688 RepID=A0A0B6XYJ0_9EUPU